MSKARDDKDSEKVRTKNIGHYVLGKTLGEGTFGKVKLGVHIFTGEKVAVKILEKDKILEVSDVERVAREIHILKMIRHPNIIQLYEIIETGKQLYLIMEYASGGELFEYIVDKGKVKEPEAARFFHQIINGVNYLHHLNIVHRDLKPENLLLDHNKTMKIVDFGLSNTYQPGEKLKTACGSPCYAAPEMIAGKKYHGSNVDIWSCGVILFALICGYLPFEDPNTAKLYKKILSGDFSIPRYVSSDARDLMKCILSTEPERRYKAEDIRQHPWFMQHNRDVEFTDNLKDEDIPIYQNILDLLTEFRFDKHEAEKYIKANKHNHETTTYYLLLKKYEKSGKELILKRDDEEDILEDERNQTQPPLYPHNLSVSQKIKNEYLPTTQLNQTLPVASHKQESLTGRKHNVPTVNVPQHHIYMETSKAEQQAGINVSYDNSFTAIKRDIQKTVGDSKSPQPQTKKSSPSSAARRRVKQIAEDLPPNKPNEAIMISESIKVNENKDNKDSARSGGKELNHTMPEPFQDSVDDVKSWQKHSVSHYKDNSVLVDPKQHQNKRANVSFNTVRDGTKAVNNTSHYNTKPKTSINTYGAALPKKKGHTTNFSYSSRPKTTCYLSNGRSTAGSKAKNQANSFLTQSMDNSKTPKNIDTRTKRSTEHYDSIGKAPTGKRSPVTADNVSNSARPSKYARASKNQSRTSNQNEEVSTEMKTYRGPFSVSCSTTKDPAMVMNDMVRSLDLYSVSFQRLGNFLIKCQKSSVKFEMELTKMENLEFVYIVRILRTGGDINKYRDVASRILSAMKL